MMPGSHVVLKNISLNPTRLGFVEVLKRMGAKIDFTYDTQDGEPRGTITAMGGKLRGIHVTKEIIPSMVDEVPLLAVLATQAAGETIIEGAEELRVKESDRLAVMAEGLKALGVEHELLPDGMWIRGRPGGVPAFSGGRIDSHGDHRIAMSFAVAALRAGGPVAIDDTANVATSFPGFGALARAAGLDLREHT